MTEIGSQTWKVASSIDFISDRLHTCINGRFITLFRHKNEIYAIDSVCYHASGPLGLGKIVEIEDLQSVTISCPWHKFLVDVEDGKRVYTAVDVSSGKPVSLGWTKGKIVQRTHQVQITSDGVYVTLNTSNDIVASDKNSTNINCMKEFPLHHEIAIQQNHS